jgi:hypothetical protein
MATADKPDIRGALRAELVRDLALGELTHEQLGEKYDRTTQAIHEFSSRNKAEIRRAKQAQSDEYQGLGYAEKWERLALREQLLRDIEERLQDPGLSDTQRNRYSVTADKLLHSIAEERGQLYVRLPVLMPSRSMMTATFTRLNDCSNTVDFR